LYRYRPFGLHHGIGPIGWVFLALLVVAVVLAVVILVRLWRGRAGIGSYLRAGGHPGPPVDPALAELRMRYARGEISWEEYAQRAANLGFSTSPGPWPGAPPGGPWSPPPGHSGPPDPPPSEPPQPPPSS